MSPRILKTSHTPHNKTLLIHPTPRYAYTFITPDQERYSGDIVRAHELGGVPVPDSLRQLWEAYKNRQEADGKRVHSGGGFSGKGYKFDESEAALATEKRKFQKAALGLQDSDDEDIENDIDQQIETMLQAKKIVHELPKSAAGATGMSTLGGQQGPSATEKLELAKKLASKINTAKNLGVDAKGATQQVAEAILKGNGPTHLITVRVRMSLFFFVGGFFWRWFDDGCGAR